MRILLIVLLFVGLYGCSTFNGPQPKFIRTQANVTVIDNVDFKDRDVLGMTICINNNCTVMLRQYPECLSHEMRHVFEGQWHPDRNLTEYCF